MEINFESYAPAEVHIKSLFGRDYLLREASGDAAIKYRTSNQQARIIENGQLAGFKDTLFDSEPELLAQCLFAADSTGKVLRDGDGNPLKTTLASVETIRGWPNQVQSKLFDALVEISPRLVSIETEESLQEDIAKLEKRLAEIRKGKEKN